MAGRIGVTSMRKILRATFKPVGFYLNRGISEPLYYRGMQAIIFPPVSELETSDQASSLTTTLKRTTILLEDKDKLMIFPLIFEGSILTRSLLSPILWNHWTTLHYNPKTRVATLVDSLPRMGMGFFSIYPMQTVKKQLADGLVNLGLTVDTVETKEQGVQDLSDDTHSGYWAATNIRALAEGVTVETQLQALSSRDLDRVIFDIDNLNEPEPELHVEPELDLEPEKVTTATLSSLEIKPGMSANFIIVAIGSSLLIASLVVATLGVTSLVGVPIISLSLFMAGFMTGGSSLGLVTGGSLMYAGFFNQNNWLQESPVSDNHKKYPQFP